MGAQSMECLLLDLFQCLSNKNRRLRSKHRSARSHLPSSH
ncbi:hypothetical protein BVRB_5g111900 [Beta vulgaris subsp. vulgaris]|nr:hypothetical protein BVRB_5g111900 [Beta vulgaris subsp. vulgaris]